MILFVKYEAAIGAIGFIAIGIALLAIIWKNAGYLKLPAEGISLNSKCPACGHRGCKLRYVQPHMEQINEKGAVRATEPMVARDCLTCGAVAYEKTVLPAEKWIGK